MPLLSESDARRWAAGDLLDAYQHLGAHPGAAHPDGAGTWFAVWAPNAEQVAVVGDFNGWDGARDPLRRVGGGLWQAFVREAEPGHHYKFRLWHGGRHFDKTDPFAFQMEAPHPTGDPAYGLAAIVTDRAFSWTDDAWMAARQGPAGLDRPMSVYEVHLGSWRHKRSGAGQSLPYREIATPLADHVERLGFTHVELMPVAEHPYYGSWGYQGVGYYAPTYRYGRPEDLKHLIDTLHARGIGVMLDWVPAHFATDPHGLARYDGTPLFEYSDPLMQAHPDWGTLVFDYGRPEVEAFLVGNALYWLREFHVDGLRVDAVASMLYRDYSRSEWRPNAHGGRENYEAIRLLQRTNAEVYRHFPQAIMAAEESTAWPGVTRPTDAGGLGFLYKWNMGWMHDTLVYASKEPIYRQHHHRDLTFPLHYAFSEQFILPLSHDEVVHGKGSLWGKMPGDSWQKAATLRLLYGHMVGHPGKKLLFMGQEFGQPSEWAHDHELPWALAEDGALHEGLLRWTAAIFTLYRDHEALWSDRPDGFRWLDLGDPEESVVAYQRTGTDAEGSERTLVFVLNWTPVPREGHRVGVPPGRYRQVLNSDHVLFGGSGVGVVDAVETEKREHHGHPASLALTVPPLGVLVLEREAA